MSPDFVCGLAEVRFGQTKSRQPVVADDAFDEAARQRVASLVIPSNQMLFPDACSLGPTWMDKQLAGTRAAPGAE